MIVALILRVATCALNSYWGLCPLYDLIVLTSANLVWLETRIEMEIIEISQAIVNLGFPCVMCLMLLKYLDKMQTGLTESINALSILVKEVYEKIDRN